MKKLTASVLLIVVSSSLAVANAQQRRNDTIPRTTDIEEVVFVQPVTGRLKVKDEVTTAQQIISNEQLKVANNPNAISAIAGKASGVRINQTNNSVNSSQSIIIRNPTTISGNPEALVVIDNVISSASVLAQLPPDAIESVNIIKGAGGAAIYGSQGLNGVVVVTTRRGTAGGGIRINFNSAVDIESIAFLPKRQRLYGQGWFGNKINVENGSWGPAFNGPLGGTVQPYGIPLYDFNGDGIIEVEANNSNLTGDEGAAIQSTFAPYGRDNVREFFQNGAIFQNTLSISSGNSNGYFGMTLGSLEKEFVVAGDKLSRYSALIKGGVKIDKWSFDGQVNFIRTKTSTADPTLYHDVLQSSADIPINQFRDNADRGYAWTIYYTSPYYRQKHVRDSSLRNYFNVIGSASYRFNDHITATYRGNMNYTNVEGRSYNDGYVNTDVFTTDGGLGGASIQSSYFQSNVNQQNYYGDLTFNANYDIATDLNLDVTVGHNYQDYRTTNSQAGGTGLLIPGLYTIPNLSSVAQPSSLNNRKFHSNIHAFIANVDLSYKKYLFFNAAGRYEMNSSLKSLITNNDFSYFFPAASISFVPTKAFDFGGNVLNFMKVTGAVERTGGISAIGGYQLYPIANVAGGYPFLGSGYLSYNPQLNYTDQRLNPEFTTKAEIGLSLGFFKDRITFDGAIFQSKTNDLITLQQTSNTSALNGQWKNVGDMEGKGVELNINFVPVKSSAIRWDIGANFTSAYSMITKLADGAKEFSLSSYSYGGIFAVEGERFPVIKGTTYVRDDQGRIVVNATTGLPQVNSQLQVLGRTTPKYILGFTTTLKVKGFTLAATADYRTGHKFFSGTKNSLAFSGNLEESATFDRTRPYIIPNSSYLQNGAYVANTNVPIYATTYNNNVPTNTNYNPVFALSEYYGGASYNSVGENFVLDATAFKIREIGLSYTFSKELLGSSKINELTIGVQARNPFTRFAKENRNYDDPETGAGGGFLSGFILADANQYPNLRTFGGNVTVTF
ncbi:SusC/RagA family TonB-linked outer membrane protein [Chryseobacterium sp. Leaf180]|uniref:SusC/RagA family TonB-linked outer membrane protein n=1 Tax=Chryseobacterium sp. Leaf180 TaxID=1736289 RepID=UPI0006F357FF|nr:SusC/RagA family TonB-linked outer membrane protein [Chryseobacterium sp. Leaf180]KQR91975.1 SusC/RagA family TonB-linked outer membrane protein [Chryseobacterium sp. Leaf180]